MQHLSRGGEQQPTDVRTVPNLVPLLGRAEQLSQKLGIDEDDRGLLSFSRSLTAWRFNHYKHERGRAARVPL